MNRRFNIGAKMYLFVAATVILSIAGISTFSYIINVGQIDSFYKRLTINSANHVRGLVDGDYLSELRDVIESDEFQELRDHAEETDDDSQIIEYLDERDLWDRYVETRNTLRSVVEDMDDIEYLYLITWSTEPSEDGNYYDMYLIDADDLPFYQSGYWEEREPEFEGVLPTDTIAPIISDGDWGWLCSGYAAVYDSSGNIICHIGCDVNMDQIMAQRRANQIYLAMGAAICALIVLLGASFLVNRIIVKPLNNLTKGMKKFAPAVGRNYKESGVIDLTIRSRDEIQDVYEETRSMQMRLIDYIDDITNIRKEKEQVEVEISKVSKVAYRDSLTGIGNKTAYTAKIKELNNRILNDDRDFSIIMVDVNCLKEINDEYGHNCGDLYLNGSCHLICEVFKHSPIYRIGGDEFVAIPNGEDYDNRVQKVAKLRQLFEEAYKDTSVDPWLRYSASVGIADCAEKDLSAEYVFARADKEMYREKVSFKQDHGMSQTPRDSSEE